MDPQLIKLAFEYAPAIFTGAIIAVAVMWMAGGALKGLGFSPFGDKSKPAEKLAAVTDATHTQLGEIERRLGAVEQDLQNRPTKDDQHRLELAFTRLEGQVMKSGATIQATANAIARIEDYMYAAAAKRSGGIAN